METRTMERRHNPTRPDPALRAARLAELVAELTGTEAATALHAVRESGSSRRERDALGLVAEAMVQVEQPPTLRLRPTRHARPDLEGESPRRGDADA